MNIRDIARLANVTPGTVSKVLNDYPDISQTTKKNILEVIEKYKYTRSSVSRTIKKTPQVGLIIEGVYNFLYTEMEKLLSERLHNASYTIMSYHDNYFSQDKTEKFNELIDYAKKHKLTGIIYIGGNFENLTLDSFKQLCCPIIFVNTVLPISLEQNLYSSIQVDHFETARRQMLRLINNGHKNIAMIISRLEDNSAYGLRLKGYKSILVEKDLIGNLGNIIEGDYIYKKTYTNLYNYLEEHPEVTALCCTADIMIPAVLKAISDIGKIPGKDIEIISFDGLELMAYCIPSVTTFEQPRIELVNCVYDLLLGLISHKRNHQNITFQCKLIMAETCS